MKSGAINSPLDSSNVKESGVRLGLQIYFGTTVPVD